MSAEPYCTCEQPYAYSPIRVLVHAAIVPATFFVCSNCLKPSSIIYQMYPSLNWNGAAVAHRAWEAKMFGSISMKGEKEV